VSTERAKTRALLGQTKHPEAAKGVHFNGQLQVLCEAGGGSHVQNDRRLHASTNQPTAH
jgi:hypothetical protein